MTERCVCCGEIIPEGQQTCPSCKVGQKMAELKPCPFCGGEPCLHGDDYYWVTCFECGVETSGDEDVSKVIEAWNRRAEDGN